MKLSIASIASTLLIATSLLSIAPVNASEINPTAEGNHLMSIIRKEGNACAVALIVKSGIEVAVENGEMDADTEMAFDAETLYSRSCLTADLNRATQISNREILGRTNSVTRSIHGMQGLHDKAVAAGYTLVSDYLDSVKK